jgi:shikimate 5-dehydrogenase
MPDEPRPTPFHNITQQEPTFYFIGVTTGKSAMMRLFPLWARELGRPEVVITGVDLRLHDEPVAYRQAVAQIKYDPLSLGALVTTHKIDLLEAARDMFEYLDPYAVLCEEVSSISKLDGRLEGHAKDPISCGLSLDALVGEGYFARTGGHVLCFGAGGSAVALALHLINKRSGADRPERFIVVNRSQGRLDSLRKMVEGLGTGIAFEYICNEDARRNDVIMGALPPEQHRHQRCYGHGRTAPARRLPAPACSARRHRLGVQLPGRLDFMRRRWPRRRRRLRRRQLATSSTGGHKSSPRSSISRWTARFSRGWRPSPEHSLTYRPDRSMKTCQARRATTAQRSWPAA